jgi:hypothetical protein
MFHFRSGPVALAVLVCLLGLGSWTGCVSEPEQQKPRPRPAEGSGSGIQEIEVLALPVALNLDQVPGPDGFIIKVFATNRKRPKSIPIESGKLEIVMYDGVPGVTGPLPPQPRRVWTYSAEQLKPFEIHSSIGVSYELAPLWGDAKPNGSRITVGVRYTAADGKVITSAPSVISVGL